MSFMKKMIIQGAGNYIAQKVLEKNVRVSQYLMGIGAGAGVLSSGEEMIVESMKQKLSPPYCVFDIGSNKGQFLELVLQRVSSQEFSIHCFEPGHETFRLLSEFAPEDARIHLNHLGIGKEKREATLYYDQAGSGLSSLTQRKLEHFGIDFNHSENVQIDTIDNYCSEHKIDQIDLLKMDIEGHEMDALIGASRMFDEQAIQMVTFEFGGCNIDTKLFFQDFWRFFHERKFHLFRITPSGYFYPITEYKEIDEQFRTTNFIAISSNTHFS